MIWRYIRYTTVYRLYDNACVQFAILIWFFFVFFQLYLYNFGLNYRHILIANRRGSCMHTLYAVANQTRLWYHEGLTSYCSSAGRVWSTKPHLKRWARFHSIAYEMLEGVDRIADYIKEFNIKSPSSVLSWNMEAKFNFLFGSQSSCLWRLGNLNFKLCLHCTTMEKKRIRILHFFSGLFAISLIEPNRTHSIWEIEFLPQQKLYRKNQFVNWFHAAIICTMAIMLSVESVGFDGNWTFMGGEVSFTYL